MSSVKNQNKRDISGINGKFNEIRQKPNSLLLPFETKTGSEVQGLDFLFLERE